MNQLLLACVFVTTVLIHVGFGQQSEFTTESGPLMEAIRQLRSKTIPEAYFLLISPQLAVPLTFAPDTKGDAYVLLLRDGPIPNGVSVDDAKKEIDRMWPQVEGRLLKPQIDEKNRRVVYFSDADWSRLAVASQPFTTTNDSVTGTLVFRGDHPRSALLKIPRGKEAEFLKTLIEQGLGHEISQFPYSIGWN